MALFIGIGIVGNEVFENSKLWVQNGGPITASEFRNLLASNKVTGSFRARHHYRRREAKWLAKAISARFGTEINLPFDWFGQKFPQLRRGDVVVAVSFRPPESSVASRSYVIKEKLDGLLRAPEDHFSFFQMQV